MSLSLLDETKNDKLLIYEISKIVKYYKDNHLKCDMNFVKKILDVYLRNDYMNLYNGVISDNSEENLAFYSRYYDGIVLNFIKTLNQREFYADASVYKEHVNIGSNDKISYYCVLVTLLYEITHAKQSMIANSDSKDDIVNIYRYCYSFILEEYELYRQIHDSVPFERYANIRSEYLASEVIDYVYPNENNIIFKLLFLDYLIYDYSLDGMYPLKYFGSLVANKDFDELIPEVTIEDNNLWERLLYGVEITKEEYNLILSMYDDLLLSYKYNLYVNRENTLNKIKKKIIGGK